MANTSLPVGFSNDPYLAGSLTYDTIIGMQQSVIACVKHFVGYEQETERNPPLLIRGSLNQSVSSNIDDQTMHELYMWPFQDALRAGAGSVMVSLHLSARVIVNAVADPRVLCVPQTESNRFSLL